MNGISDGILTSQDVGIQIFVLQGHCKEPLLRGVGDDDQGEGGPQQGHQDAQVHQGAPQQRQGPQELPAEAGVRLRGRARPLGEVDADPVRHRGIHNGGRRDLGEH